MKPKIDWLITEMEVYGGAERFVASIVPILNNIGWKTRLIILKKGVRCIDDLNNKRISIIELNHHTPILSAINLLDLWKYDKPSLIHTHLYHAGIIGRIFARMSGIPKILVHQHGYEFNRPIVRSLIDRFSHPLVTGYICSCKAVANLLSQREHIPSSKIHVIYNGISTRSRNHLIPKPEGWMIPENKFCIGSVGRIVPEKGHIWLLKAITSLINNGKDIYAIILGEGHQREELINLTRDLGMDKRIFWPGNKTEIDQWLSHFDLFVLPSLWEGIPLALLEAMSVGLPVIANQVGGIPEIIESTDTGITIPPQNLPALIDTIDYLIGNPIIRSKIGENASNHVQKHFSLDTTVNKIDLLYRHLLNE